MTVVALEQAVAAPFATRQLADLGARVIKIERPGGGDFARGYDTTVKGLSSYFVWLNRSKESLTLDLKQPEAAGRPRAAARARRRLRAEPRAGRGRSARHRARRPARAAIRGSSSAACPATARPARTRTKKAYDLLVQSEVGLLSMTGTDEAPAKVGISVADIAAGMYAYSGILTALLARDRDRPRRVGRRVAVRRARASGWAQPAYYTGYGGTARRRAPARTTRRSRRTARSRPATAARSASAIQNAREWTRFCADVLRRPELADDPIGSRTNPLRVRNRAGAARGDRRGLRAALDQRARSSASTRRSIACARMNSIAEFLAHPQLAGARSLARHRLARRPAARARFRRCAIGRRRAASWARCRRSASTPTRFSQELGFGAADRRRLAHGRE